MIPGAISVNFPIAPKHGAAAAGATRNLQYLADTGTTEDETTVALSNGKLATLLVGPDAAVRVHWSSATSITVATTDPAIGAGRAITWTVDANSQHLAIEAADGTSAYEAWVWTSSPEPE